MDEVAHRAPNTLLLAEAFWLMEGYFVRSLGMHRVYNSAFMNMLKEEENSKYRDVMKNVLRFNPEILRRFVNFMNNPDEDPAVSQFGKGDKYFGVATLMVTMPGLPMFGHGQVEGFGEKYGMEYARGYWNEEADLALIRRHEREIFPLLKMRHLFSSVENFVLYDLVTDAGHVNEDVFAYSNRADGSRALVIYNNRYAEASGHIRRSVGISAEAAGHRHLVHKSLCEGLDLKGEAGVYYVFRDLRSGLDYIRCGMSLATDGLAVSLGAYHANVFLDFRELYDDDSRALMRLEQGLGGRGVPDMLEALAEVRHAPVLEPLRALLRPDLLEGEIRCLFQEGLIPGALRGRLENFLEAVKAHTGSRGETALVAGRIGLTIKAVASLPVFLETQGEPGRDAFERIGHLMGREGFARQAFVWAVSAHLGRLAPGDDPGRTGRAWLEELRLGRAMQGALGLSEEAASREMRRLAILTEFPGWKTGDDPGALAGFFEGLLQDAAVQEHLGFKAFDGVWWFGRGRRARPWWWSCSRRHVFTPNCLNCCPPRATGWRLYPEGSGRPPNLPAPAEPPLNGEKKMSILSGIKKSVPTGDR